MNHMRVSAGLASKASIVYGPKVYGTRVYGSSVYKTNVWSVSAILLSVFK